MMHETKQIFTFGQILMFENLHYQWFTNLVMSHD